MATVATGANPCEATVGFGSLWVANDGSGTVARVDPATGRVEQRIRAARGVCSVTVAAGAVWAASYRTGVLYKIDPRRGRVTARIRVGSVPVAVVTAGASVWVANWSSGTVVRVDTRRNRIAARYEAGQWPAGLAVVRAAVWIGFGRDATSIGRLDPASGEIARIAIGRRAPGALARAFGSIWATTQENAIVRVDPATRRTVATVSIPGNPAFAAAGTDGTLWVAAKAANTIIRVDPQTNRVIDSTPAGPGAYDVVAAAGDMWVTSYAGSDIWRFSTR